MFKFITAAGLAAALLLTATCTSTQAASNGSDGAHTIRLRTWAGSACAHSEPSVHLTQTARGFVLSYPTLTATGNRIVNCQVILDVMAPTGWTYAVAQTSTTGYAHLDPSATARAGLTWYNTGTPMTGKAIQMLAGPYDNWWQAEHYSDQLIWAPCGSDGYLSVNGTLVISGPPTSSMTVFNSSVVQLAWRTC